MTMNEINKRFYGSWVIIDSPTKTKNGNISKGRVLFAGERKKELADKLGELDIERGAFFRVGGATEESLYLYM